MTHPKPSRRPELTALAAAAVTVVLWSSAFVSIRSAGEHYSPGALALGRLLAGSLALGAVLLWRREGLPPRAAWPGIIAAGVMWFGVYMVALNWGEQQVDAGTAALVVNVGPLLMALLAARFLGEKVPPRLMLGMAVSFTGAAVVGLSVSSGSGEGGASALGVALCLVAAIAYATGVVLQKPALAHAGALQVTTWSCLLGTAACLPFAWQLVDEVSRAPLTATANMVYLGLFPTALAFTTWAYALARTTAGKMGATTYAVPALVVGMSWLALDEVPGPVTLGGGALCLAGVAVSRSRSRRERKRPGLEAERSGAEDGSGAAAGGTEPDAEPEIPARERG